MTEQRWVATGTDGLTDFVLVDDEVPAPGPGQVTIRVRAAGVNPADLKHVSRATSFPAPVGYEVAGVITAIGENTKTASGGGAVGDEVLAFRVVGGYSTALTVPARDVFARASSIPVEQAAGLLLAGTTAADMLRVARVAAGETVLLHGASGAVGAAVLQLARRRGVRVVGTCGPDSIERVTRFDGIPVVYGTGLAERVHAAAPTGFDAALDASGTDNALDVSLTEVPDRSRIVTIAAPARAAADGFVAIGGAQPESRAFRDEVRAELIALAAAGELEVPIARTFPFAEAVEALALVASGRAGGKVALVR